MPRSLPSPIVRILRQPRWSLADARLVLDAVADTGHLFLEFARTHEVDVQRLYAEPSSQPGRPRPTSPTPR